MPNYVNITLDTVAPSGISVLINDDADKTTSSLVTLTVECDDADLSGYQMKVWGTADAPAENDAVWETYQETKNIMLPVGDGLKTVYVKVRDDVWNESAAESDSIMLYEKLPSVVGLSVNNSRISLVDGKSFTVGVFGIDEDIDALKVVIVQNANDAHDAVTNISIPTANGSKLEEDNGDIPCIGGYLESEYRVNSVHGLSFTINASDVSSVAPGDGIKIVKVFVRSAETGSWSV